MKLINMEMESGSFTVFEKLEKTVLWEEVSIQEAWKRRLSQSINQSGFCRDFFPHRSTIFKAQIGLFGI